MFPKDVIEFFRSVIKDNIDKRRNGVVRPDLIHLLLEARKGHLKSDFGEDKLEGFASVEESEVGRNGQPKELTDDDIVSQAMLFLFAGFDTASTTSCFLAHELAIHPDIQVKLQEEVDGVNRQCNGKIPFETLLSMKYLDQVVCGKW